MQTRLDKEVGFMEQGLRVRAQRQQVLATNIANADTPNYKAKDLDFNQAMKAALGNTGSQENMSVTNSKHIGSANNVSAQVKERSNLQNSADGNTVDMDVEQSQFAENALQYETLVSMINGTYKNINSVMQG